MHLMSGVIIESSRTGDIRLLHEDDRYLIVSKPAGLLVHRTPLDAHEPENLKDLLKAHISGRIDPVHRLDKPTSGVIVFGKDAEAINACKTQFEARKTDKSYLAVVRGHVDHEGCIGKPLPKGITGPPKLSRTSYASVATCDLPYPVTRYESARLSLVQCEPHTGRYHQIRLHFRHFRHPIIGDSQHGDKHQNRAFTEFTGLPGLLLHARSFAFDHVEGGRLHVTAAVPPSWNALDLHAKWNLEPYRTEAALHSPNPRLPGQSPEDSAP
jgi:tRNA pseudouridine65 synthase